MWRVLAIAVVAVAVASSAVRDASAQGADDAVPPVTAPLTLSEMIRNAGHALSPEVGAYLDADAAHTEKFVQPVLTVDLFAASLADERSRQIVLTALRQVVALDPGSVSPPPSGLAELDRLAVARRTAAQLAARNWIQGLDANDPAWLFRGSEALGAANQAEGEWYVLLNQILAGAQASRQ